MKISILIPSKKLKVFEQSWIDQYQKRLSKHCTFTIELLKDRDDPDLFEKKIDPSAHIVALDPRGTSLSTEKFATWFDTHKNQSTKKVVFLIGGSYGLPVTTLKKAHTQLSLSEFTFPHRLALLILTEQIYRAHSFLAGEPYHHGDSVA